MFDIIKMNLQLFANEVQTTLLDGLSVEMKTFYDMTLLDEAQANLVHDQFAQKRPIPQGSGSAAVVKSDVSQLSRADREEIIRRVQRGEKIRF